MSLSKDTSRKAYSHHHPRIFSPPPSLPQDFFFDPRLLDFDSSRLVHAPNPKMRTRESGLFTSLPINLNVPWSRLLETRSLKKPQASLNLNNSS